jgi:hypothetical protein
MQIGERQRTWTVELGGLVGITQFVRIIRYQAFRFTSVRIGRRTTVTVTYIPLTVVDPTRRRHKVRFPAVNRNPNRGPRQQ